MTTSTHAPGRDAVRGQAPLGAYFPGSHRRPIAHGTAGGYRAHFRYDEPMCEPCRQADRTRRGKPPRRRAACGTRSGYNRHTRLGEAACAPCREAQARGQDEYLRERRGDPWTYRDLIPAAAELAAHGMDTAEIATALGTSRRRAGRALARARRGETA